MMSMCKLRSDKHDGEEGDFDEGLAESEWCTEYLHKAAPSASYPADLLILPKHATTLECRARVGHRYSREKCERMILSILQNYR